MARARGVFELRAVFRAAADDARSHTAGRRWESCIAARTVAQAIPLHELLGLLSHVMSCTQAFRFMSYSAHDMALHHVTLHDEALHDRALHDMAFPRRRSAS